jgi:predicted RNA binding protein YcfA (HicA-like mRNA interferase family)
LLGGRRGNEQPARLCFEPCSEPDRENYNAVAPMSDDLLEQMRRNPLGNWTIGDVEKVCRAHGLWFRAGQGTSHFHVKHPAAVEILTIPARRPIKPVYIRKLVRYIDVHGGRK